MALFVRALFGSLRNALDLEAFSASRVTIETRRRFVAVATDGEVRVMDTPLQYENRPGVLQLIVPAPQGAPA
jgi:diacylglycerol kinase family enzyme